MMECTNAAVSAAAAASAAGSESGSESGGGGGGTGKSSEEANKATLMATLMAARAIAASKERQQHHQVGCKDPQLHNLTGLTRFFKRQIGTLTVVLSQRFSLHLTSFAS